MKRWLRFAEWLVYLGVALAAVIGQFGFKAGLIIFGATVIVSREIPSRAA
jgi:hypothetical protein